MGNCENFKSPSAFGLKICTSDITCVNGCPLAVAQGPYIIWASWAPLSSNCGTAIISLTPI